MAAEISPAAFVRRSTSRRDASTRRSPASAQLITDFLKVLACRVVRAWWRRRPFVNALCFWFDLGRLSGSGIIGHDGIALVGGQFDIDLPLAFNEGDQLILTLEGLAGLLLQVRQLRPQRGNIAAEVCFTTVEMA